jgi:hypothetical protein
MIPLHIHISDFVGELRRQGVAEKIEAERRDLEHRAIATLTEEERRHLHSALRKIIMERAAVVPMDEPGDEPP